MELEIIIVDAKIITNKTEICNEFNKFFTNIGPKLADKLNTENKKCYENYFKKSHSYLICIWLSRWKHCYKTYLDPANKKLLRPWRDLYEVT